MKRRVLYLIGVYLLTVLIFMAAKLAFMACYAGSNPFTISDVTDVIVHGMSLDLSMGLYVISIPFLCLMVSIWWPVRLLRLLLRIYYVILSLALALAFVADTSLYEFWLFKLDASCLQYLETPTEAMASVSTGYLMVRLLVVVLLTALFTWLYWHVPLRLTKVSHRILSTIGAVLVIPLIVIGIRGGLDESTTNIGQVYYSQNQFLNHSAVNPVFSFLASFEKTASVNVVYQLMDDAECERLISELYDTRSLETDSLLITRTPNIIVILLESCGGKFTEIGGRQDVTPHLNQLAHEGIYFTNCYGNTWRTDRGTVCTWSGYPSFPSMSVMKIPSKSRTMPNIAKSLRQERGYHTYYIYGGDINFTNMRSYLVAGGFEALTSKDDYSSEQQRTAKWGVRDDITFETLYDMVQTARQPYLIGFSTLSSHAPWDVPIHHFDDEILNAFYYLDQCVGTFIGKLRQTEAWKNTLVVLLPDHGIPYGGMDETDPLLNHIPMIWVGGAVKAPRRIDTLCNQTDLPATLLGQLGVSHDEYTFSRDVLSRTYQQPFAIHTYTEGFTVLDSETFLNFDMVSNRLVKQVGPDNAKLLKRGNAVLQAASKDLNER